MLILNFNQQVTPDLLKQAIHVAQHFSAIKDPGSDTAGVGVFGGDNDSTKKTYFVEYRGKDGIEFYTFQRLHSGADQLIYTHDRNLAAKLRFLRQIGSILGGGVITDQDDPDFRYIVEPLSDPYAGLKIRPVSVRHFSKWHAALQSADPAILPLIIPTAAVFDIPADVLSYALTPDNSQYVLPANWLEYKIWSELPGEFLYNNGRIILRTNLGYSKQTFQTDFNSLDPAFCRLCQEQAGQHDSNFTRKHLRQLILIPGIHLPPETTLTAFGGFPLTGLIRVFYDFTEHNPLFCWNMWDYGSVYPALTRRSDRLLFQAEYKTIEERFYNDTPILMQRIDSAFHTVTSLHGPWALDLLYDPNQAAYLLIDACPAEQAAFWEFRHGNELELALWHMGNNKARLHTAYKCARRAARDWFEPDADLSHLSF